MSNDVILPSYVKTFSCIAEKCEDTCCQTWDVRFDKLSYEKLLGSLKSDHRENIFDEHVKRYKESDNSSYYAYINMREDGFCPFLTSTKSCDLHSAYGIDVLSDVCAFYPRVINQVITNKEINGALSCPEMVRKCIQSGLPDEYYITGSTDIFPRQDRFTVQRQFDPANTDAYLSYFPLVRDAMYSIVKSSRKNLMMQLYGLANYTSRLSAFYYSGCDAVRKNEFTRVQNHILKEQPRILEFIYTIDSDNVFTEGFINSLIYTNVSQSKNKKYTALANMVLDYKNSLYAEHDIESIFDLKDETQQFIDTSIDEILSAYLANCIYREWYITLPSPFVYVFMIIIRIAMIRYIARLYIRLRLSDKNKDDYSKSDVSKLMVEVIYLHARSIDHNIPYLQVVYQAMQEQDMFNMDFLIPLIKCN